MTDSLEDADVPSRPYDWRLALRALGYLRQHKLEAVASLALTMLSAPIYLAGALLTGAAVDLFLAPDPSKPPTGFVLFVKQAVDFAGFGGSRQLGIVFMAVLFLAANLVEAAVEFARMVVMENMGQRIMFDLREELFAHLQRVSIKFYDQTRVGQLMTRISSDVGGLNEMLTSGVIGLLSNLAIVFYVLIWMFKTNWRLALVSFAILPLLITLATWFRIGVRSAYRAIGVQMSAMNGFLQEHLSGMLLVQLFNREARQMKAFDRINKAYQKADVDTNFYAAVFYPGVEILTTAGIALIIWYGAGQVIRGAATLGTLIAFIELAGNLYNPISEIGEKYNVLQSAMASCERVFKILDEPVMQAHPEPKRLTRVRGRIEFRDVWFAYRDEDWVLKDISFVAEPGEKVALVGHTGAGKTTVTNLLLRFYEIQRGQILLDDVDIRELDLHELRSNFGVVLQDVFLFSRDIAANIRLGNQAITEAMAAAAAGKVGADDFISALKQGYRSEVRERGAGLSVGEKQLIGFARALAFDRRVLILDEATSSIDTKTEMLIRDAVERLMLGRTALVIAHRLSTIQSVDKIIVMHKGEVREVGNHQALLDKRGLYWNLYQLQFSRDSAPVVEPVAEPRSFQHASSHGGAT